MIPLRITLKNFLSYGPQEQIINFEPYHLICLSGKNGHGKSALLDAITWAVWGQARKTSGTAKADADLLRLGETFMMVSFDFSCNGQTYRIKREYAKTFAKPYSSLDFGVLESQTHKFKPLTDKTIRGTQEIIQETIGISYESFINTAFLRQGNANEFSKKSPQERKDVLATILSLHQYEALRKQAQDKVREASSKTALLQETSLKLTEELEKEESINNQLGIVLKKFDELIDNETSCTQKQQDLWRQQDDIRHKLEMLRLLDYKLSQLTIQEREEQEDVRSLLTTWRSVNRTLRSITDRSALEQEKKSLHQELKRQQESLQRHLTCKEEYLQVKEEEQTYRTKMKEHHQSTLHHQKVVVERLHIQKDTLTVLIAQYQTSLQQAQEELLALEQKKSLLEKKREAHLKNNSAEIEKNFEKRKTHYHMWVSRLQQIHTEQKQLAQKQYLTQESDNPSCPLCEQNLSASRKNFLKTKFLELERWHAHRRSRLERATKKLKELLLQQHAQLQVLQEQQKEAQQISISIDELNKTIQKTQQSLLDLTTKHMHASKTLQELEVTIVQHRDQLKESEHQSEKQLEDDPQYQTVAAKRIKLESELKETSYHATIHQEIVKKLEDIEYKLREYDSLAQEKTKQEQRKDTIFSLLKSLKNIKKFQQDIRKDQAPFTTLSDQQHTLNIKQEELTYALRELSNTKEVLLQEKGRLEEQKNSIERLKKEQILHQLRLQELTQDIFDYSAIAAALSKNGIQALIIEDAIPEIEHEANALLGQLTDNQTHIMIESVRDLKKGGTRETLDINISDPMGIRPYELFSGGEAFRIDFALRIAISKLLARRAGTSLQTLIIDEGFGSQDEEGLSRLMDAIYKIQDNFCKVIIVSHLQALKEQFPVHFVISKESQGSTVQVIEHG